MGINLNSAWSRISFLAVVLLSSGVLALSSAKAFLAAYDNSSSNPKLWRQASWLEPGNAEYWRHAGLSRHWDLSAESTAEAIRNLEIATKVNPRSADLWMELADAYQTSGDPVHAQESFEEAQAHYPISPEVAWRYGSFLLYQGKFTEGYSEIRRALSMDPSLLASAISECWQSDPNIASILDNVLPAGPEYFRGAIDYFLSHHLPDAALAVWNRQQQLGLSIAMADTNSLVDALIDEDRSAEALETWHQALQLTKWPQNPPNDRSLVFNGGFENNLANGGYDWREEAVNGIHFDFDNRTVHSGLRSLRIEFDGKFNLDFHNLYQYISVEPGTRYHFSAYLRTEAISTDRGIAFEILDLHHPSELQLRTSEIIGSNPWIQVQADFVTGPDTRVVKVNLARIPSWKFDNKLSGTVWVDDVSLTPYFGASQDGAG